MRVCLLLDSLKHVAGQLRNYSSCKPSKKVLVLIAPGTEEMECITIVDIVRRANIDVKLAGLCDKEPTKCGQNVKILPDIAFCDAKDTYDAIILPGGFDGTTAFSESKTLGTVLKEQECKGRIVAAICAAPLALRAHGIGFGKCITSYPAVESDLMNGCKYTYKQDEVVVDKCLITSRGPGTSSKFALTIVECLVGKEKAKEIAKGMLISY